ncbi:MAG: cadmium-translocating P-type ATPase [Clostridiales bacterium]|nr:cadmium-translocating P-type ATPase [Clostridiales bacterium]
MSKKQKRILMRLLLAAAICILPIAMSMGDLPRLGIFLCAYFIAGYDVLWEAALGIIHGEVFDENFLMALATVGAFLLGEYLEAMAVMVFYQVGELFQSYAVGKSRRSIADLMDIRPDYAIRLNDGAEEELDPEDVSVGDTILVRPGERIPLDGVVLTGHTTLDTSALTGESLPRDAGPGAEVVSGCINLTGILTIQVTKEYSESTVAKILDLVENASSRKANVENFITRFARYYTPTVVLAAVALAFLPPLLIPGALLGVWVERALNFLVVSCPCALVISVPLSFFGGIGGAGKCGILIKGSNYLEVLSRVDTVVFDKTGTLSRGEFSVTGIYPQDPLTKEELLSLAAHCETYSNHPIARSILAAYPGTVDAGRIGELTDLPGRGLRVTVDGSTITIGNRALMESCGITPMEDLTGCTMVHLSQSGRYLGAIAVADTLKPDAKEAIRQLRQSGIRRAVMLTGDSDAIGKQAAKELYLDEVFTELLPQDKVEQMERILKGQHGNVAYVGDGINDAPVLARADVGIAMGALGSDAAIEAADVVIMNDELSSIPIAMTIARKTMTIVKQNIVFALGVKGLVLALSVFGLASMWAAVFADVGVSVIAIINAIRTLSVKGIR